MNRKEFLDELAFLLQDIEDVERDEAIQYYQDYFDEAGIENEQQVINELGTPEKVAKTEGSYTGEYIRKMLPQKGKKK